MIELKQGDIVKIKGKVLYADGLKEKISKKTWVVEEKDGGLVLPNLAEGEECILIGNQEQGIFPEFLPLMDIVKIDQGSVPQNYRVLKDVDEKGWKKDDIVKITGNVAKETLEGGWLEKVADNLPHKHVLIVVDPIKLGLVANNIQ